jgi:hypothetical protein
VRASSTSITRLAAAGAVAALALAGCASGGDAPAATTSPSSTATATAPTEESPTAEPSPTLPANASPLSGRAGGEGKRVLIVKYDNTPNAQPHSGLTKADVVYVEEVEYGLTRIAAVFSTSLPKTVGPVRSARISDLELFANYQDAAFAYSGAQHRLRPLIAASDLVDVSGDQGPYGYFRDGSRPAPYNFMGQPEKLLQRAKGSAVAQDIGFEFSLDAPADGRAVRAVKASYPSSSAKFVYNAKTGRFDVSLNGRPARATEGGIQHATTVVIQYVKQYDSGFGDKFGGRTPKEDTVGTGYGWVLRDGQAYKVRWTRADEAAPTQFVGANGQVVPFKPGQVWVVLVNRKEPATFAWAKAS